MAHFEDCTHVLSRSSELIKQEAFRTLLEEYVLKLKLNENSNSERR